MLQASQTNVARVGHEIPDSHLLSDSSLLAKIPERLGGINPTRQAPVHELGDIYPAFADLALVHKNVSGPQLRGQVPLGERRFPPHLSKHGRQIPVALCMLGLGHAQQCRGSFACYRLDNTLECRRAGEKWVKIDVADC
jgi:hypothetical protein